VVDKR